MVIKIQNAMVISVHLAHVLELEVVLLSLVRFFFVSSILYRPLFHTIRDPFSE